MRSTLPLAGISALALLLSGCGGSNAQPASASTAPPPPAVGIITVTPQALTMTTELPGRLEASRVAEVRARVAGIVLEREFREGSEVTAGAVLYRIDPAPMQAALNSAKAALAKAEANAKQARLKAERYQPLVKTKAISRQDYDDAVAARDQALADIAAAKAAVQSAQLNLDYATVTAPIGGRIGRAMVTEGALVGQSEATALATIQQVDPLYVNLTQSSAELLRLRQALASGALTGLDDSNANLTLTTEDGTPYPYPGHLLFSDITVDPTTGAVTLRAEVPNPDHLLLPGMYVRAHVEQGLANAAITVPQQAVSRSTQGEASVMVVGDDGTASVRPVTVGAAHDNQWIITDGLHAGDRVIVDGLQKIRPGSPVSAVAWQDPHSSNTSPQADNSRNTRLAGAD